MSFDVEAGQTLGIIGENGSGKSTLLKILAGISKPTAGEVITQGRISALIELGAGFHPEISGRENIFINGVILGLTRKQIQEKYDEIVRFAELEEFIDNPVKSYSSGMFMRLGFSIAINVNPDILLVDEVLAVGDASFVPKCLDKINEFRRHGKTIIYVSHDLATIETDLRRRHLDQEGQDRDARLSQARGRRLPGIRRQEGREKDAGPAWRGERRRAGQGEALGQPGDRDRATSGCSTAAGQEKYIFQSDEPLAVEFDVHGRTAPRTISSSASASSTAKGSAATAPTRCWRIMPPSRSQGDGKVRLAIPALGLVNGTYFLDIAVHKRDGYPFDYHHFQYSFRVTSSHRDVGIARIPHRWEFSENIVLKKNENL